MLVRFLRGDLFQLASVQDKVISIGTEKVRHFTAKHEESIDFSKLAGRVVGIVGGVVDGVVG